MESLESRLWPIPVLAIVVAVAVGIVIPQLDLRVDSDLPTGVGSAVFNGGADTARSVLSSIAGSLITATSLTFSLTVVALQLASSQASPRVLRLFARDRQVHLTLAAFLGTFAYSLTVLRTVRNDTDEVPEFVPRIAITAAFVLTLLSVIMLVVFLAHLASQLRLETIVKDIHGETDETIDLIAGSVADLPAYPHRFSTPQNATSILATSSGFITSLDRTGLLDVASERGLVIEEVRRVGDNVVDGTPLARWWRSGNSSTPLDHDAIADEVRTAHKIGYERTAAQDIDFGVQQIVDIGVRALSPGINDPITAVNALGHLGALVTRIVTMPTTPAALADSDGTLRVVTRRVLPGETVHLALSQIRHYGATDAVLVRRFLQVISDLAYTCDDPAVTDALRYQLAALDRQLRQDDSDPAARNELLDETAQVLASISPAG